MSEHTRWMQEALAAARAAGSYGAVPVGAVLVKDGEMLARAGNGRERLAHAELLVLLKAGHAAEGATLYVTLEPCPMCAGAIALSRLSAVIFGAFDPRMGCTGSIYRLTEDPALGMGTVEAHGGLLETECAALLTAFFKERRET